MADINESEITVWAYILRREGRYRGVLEKTGVLC